MKIFFTLLLIFYFTISFGQKDSVAPVKAGTIFYGDAGIIEDDTCLIRKPAGDSLRRDTLPISAVVPHKDKKKLMITVYDSIKSYCYENKTEIPSQKQCSIIGYIAIVEYKKFNKGQHVKINKITQPQRVEVNSFPDEFSDILNETVKRYFADSAAFCTQEYNKALSANLPHTSFNVDNDKCKLFEAAVKELNLECRVVGTGADFTKYEIIFRKRNELILLGILFNKKVQKPKKIPVVEVVKNDTRKRKRIAVKQTV